MVAISTTIRRPEEMSGIVTSQLEANVILPN
jgi:hypothetical protein